MKAAALRFLGAVLGLIFLIGGMDFLFVPMYRGRFAPHLYRWLIPITFLILAWRFLRYAVRGK